MFKDRHDAANQLAVALGRWRGHHPLVLAIPRGAVPMGRLIAERLEGDWDVVLVRKLHAPHQPELAVGSVAENGWTYLTPHARRTGADPAYIDHEKQAQLQLIRQRRAQYTPLHAPIDPAGRVVIVVDDGMATGATMIAALHALRHQKPAQLICAVPVAPAETLETVRFLADDVVCLEVPDWFQAVGQFYREFPQISDEEVVALLKDRSAGV